MAIHRASDPGRLDETEWSQLRQRLARPEVAAGIPELASLSQEPSLLPPGRPPRQAAAPGQLERQRAVYEARRAKGVIALQQFRDTSSLDVYDDAGRAGRATLINLNPTINAWYVLKVEFDDTTLLTYHLANARPASQDLVLDPASPRGLTIADDRGRRPCDLWSQATTAQIASARASLTPYVGLCDGSLTVRLPTRGHRTAREWTADFLRDNVWGGEQLTVLVRSTVYQDAYLETGEVVTDGAPVSDYGSQGPLAARIDPGRTEAALSHPELGISVTARVGMLAGRWYPARFDADVFVSAMLPGLVDPAILRTDRDRAAALDAVESTALVYLVGFDLEQFALGFAVGTDHPRVGWSSRALPEVSEPDLQGPDGIGDITPLVAIAVIPPGLAERSVAAFTGGFKRDHGAFRTSALAHVNAGSHYGVIDSGAVLSKLQPGLSTLYVLDDGRVDMKQWTRDDDALLERIAFARQNGVPLVERDPDRGLAVPGPLVNHWSDGNWSGSQDGKLRTVRGGACITERAGRRFLLYAYFSSATPSAMARVFQAYDCEHAMQLDMNALEHTYLALYSAVDGDLRVEHLVRGMSVLDKPIGDAILPRFLGFADNRDFFYVSRRPPPTGSKTPAPEILR